MSGQSNIRRTLIAAFASLLMSSVAVGAAIGPASVSIDSRQVALNA